MDAKNTALRTQKKPLLLIDLIPSTAWGSNLRKRYPEQWDFFRKNCYRSAGHRCEICKTPGRMECHEVWSYKKPPTQKLERLICLCHLCHSAQHYGLSEVRGMAAEVDSHILAINGWSKKQLDEHIRSAFSLWNERNKIQWKTTTLFLDKEVLALKKIQ